MASLENKVPIEGTRRLVSIDILRGFAVFGVLLVNGPSMNSPVTMDGLDFAFKNGEANLWYADIILSFATGYFYPIFAGLFGVSAAIFLSRNSSTLYVRRMLMLLFFGLCQGCLIWWGDVLAIYAILGLSLTFLATRSAKTIFRVFQITIISAVAFSVAIYFVHEGGDFYPPVDSLAAYQQGDFFVVSAQRLLDYMWTYVPWAVTRIDMPQFLHTSLFIMQLLLCFTAGFYFYSSGHLRQVIKDKTSAIQLFWISFAATIVLTLIRDNFAQLDDALTIAGGFARSLFYASVILLVCHYRLGLGILKPLAWVGRMSLSNYLFHNLSVSLMLYGYGFGLYGKIGPFDQMPFLLGLMAFSVAFSFLWLQFFQYGPLEWIWRIATYKKRLPIGKSVLQPIA
jgi:uncharacterized protein